MAANQSDVVGHILRLKETFNPQKITAFKFKLEDDSRFNNINNY